MFETEYIPSVMNNETEIFIGIDPDCEKSGVATLRRYDRNVQLQTLSFPELIKYLLKVKRECGSTSIPYLVTIEASWKIQANWHVMGQKMSVARAASMGKAVGRNHETGRKISEMCDALDIPHKDVLPLRRIWGKTGKEKVSHEELAIFIDNLSKRSNQEQRDAALLAWNEAGFPIRINPETKRKSKMS